MVMVMSVMKLHVRACVCVRARVRACMRVLCHLCFVAIANINYLMWSSNMLFSLAHCEFDI